MKRTYQGGALFLPMDQQIDAIVFILEKLVMHLHDIDLLWEYVEKCFLWLPHGY